MARRDSRARWERRVSRSSRKRTLVLVGLAVFVVVDIVLIAAAVGLLGGDDDSVHTEPRVTPPIASSEASTPQPSEPPAPPAASPVLRTLAAVDEQIAWRAERGSCDAQAVIEVTTDGGLSWTQTEPQSIGGREVLWLWAQDASYAQAVLTMGDDCEIGGARTFTGGDFWQSNADPLAVAAYLNPQLGIVAPEQVEAPCAVPVDVALREGGTAVLCDDGTVHQRADDGAWTSISVPGALSLTAAGDGYAIAVQQTEGCDGIAVVRIAAEVFAGEGWSSEQRACLTGAVDITATVIDASDSTVWLWSGEGVLAVPIEEIFA